MAQLWINVLLPRVIFQKQKIPKPKKPHLNKNLTLI